MSTKSGGGNNQQPGNSYITPAIIFETIYVDSVPKLKNSDNLVHYEVGKSGNKYATCITSNDNDGLFSNQWVMLNELVECLEPLVKVVTIQIF
jgi:hypothetical protein